MGLFYCSDIKGLRGFSRVEILTTFVILGTEKSLKNILCPFCAQIVPWLFFKQVEFDPHSNLKEMKLNLFLLAFITHFKKPSCPKKNPFKVIPSKLKTWLLETLRH
ncbi:conserved hypothetical protein [Moraxellaceae bacterium 17A]|nr:conserved hypothetical protein [Moraxellaceae bacterium 17A]